MPGGPWQQQQSTKPTAGRLTLKSVLNDTQRAAGVSKETAVRQALSLSHEDDKPADPHLKKGLNQSTRRVTEARVQNDAARRNRSPSDCGQCVGQPGMRARAPDDHGVLVRDVLAVRLHLLRARLLHGHPEVDVLREADLLVKQRGAADGAELGALVGEAAEHAR